MDMLFIVKKVVGELMSPLSIGLIVATLGLFSLFLSRYRVAKVLLLFSLLWIALFSYGPVSNALLKPLENHHPALLKTPVGIDYVLVLGNGHKTDACLPITTELDPTAVIRLSEGIRHYNKLGNAKLVVSGYAGLYDKNCHAQMQKRLAIALGVDAADIITFNTPKDTQEEAEAMKKLSGTKPFILVTTASHMPRAYEIFKKQGLNPIAAPTDYHARGTSEWLHMPKGDALRGSDIAFHEYYGLIWEWIKQ
jgi:uncharacterized SAM-binding protein YcdF (DUF218 family)